MLGLKGQSQKSSPIPTAKYVFHIFSIYVVKKVGYLGRDEIDSEAGQAFSRVEGLLTVGSPVTCFIFLALLSDKQQGPWNSDNPPAGD